MIEVVSLHAALIWSLLFLRMMGVSATVFSRVYSGRAALTARSQADILKRYTRE